MERKVVRVPVLEDDELLSAQDLIDFTPVHRCCQIFNVLVCFLVLGHDTEMAIHRVYIHRQKSVILSSSASHHTLMI